MFCFSFQLHENTITSIACGVIFVFILVGVIAYVYCKRNRVEVGGEFEMLNTTNASNSSDVIVTVKNPGFGQGIV